MTERFHQSYCKTLLNDCPALLKLQLGKGRKASRAMEAGSLLDYLVFEQDDRYEIVDARYKSGPRAGQQCEDWTGREAQDAREGVRASGLLPVLQCEVDELAPTALAIRMRIVALSREMAGGAVVKLTYQPRIQWTSELGVECEGTPDVVVTVHQQDIIKVCTIDVKHTAFVSPAKLKRQVYDMGWDIQGAAYREAAKAWAEAEHGGMAYHGEHVMLCSSALDIGLPPLARRLSHVYMEVGKRRWEKGQRIWRMCVESDYWPSYDENDIEPSHFHVRTLEEYDENQFDTNQGEP